MASENLKIDENTRNVLGAITNDVNEFIKNLRVNPATGRLLVDAHVTSTNTSIGDTIPGGTAGSVLFLGLGSTLAQDNAHFFWDDTSNFLGLGTNTPTQTLDIRGTLRIDDGSAVIGYVWTATDTLGNGTWEPAPSAASAYNLIQNVGISVTQRTTINLSNLLVATDSGGKTALTIDVAALATDSTFITDLTNNTTFLDDLINSTYFTTNLANNSNFISTLTSNVTFQGDINTIVNTSGAGGHEIQDNGTPLPKEPALNFVDFFTVTDNAGISTDVDIDIAGLTSDSTFISDIVTIINNSGSSLMIDLTTQVGTSILPLANGGTQTALSDPGANTIYVWDDTDNATALATIGSGLSYNHGSHTLSASGVSASAEQNLGGFHGSGGNSYSPECMTSSSDGSVLFAAYYNVNSNEYTVVRFDKDPNSGEFYVTHTVSSDNSDGSNAGLAIVGSFVYLSFQGAGGTTGKLFVDRFDLADLANKTLMTTGSPSMANWNGMFTDGTDLYISLADTVFTQYTISGTTLTSGGTLTGGLSGATSPFYDGTNVFMINASTFVVNSYTFGGGTFTFVNTATLKQLSLNTNTTSGVGFCNIDSTVFFIGYNAEITASTNTDSTLILKAFTKPL